MSRQIGPHDQWQPAAALEDRIRALELRVEALNDAVTALSEQQAGRRRRPDLDSTDRGAVRDDR